MKTSEYLPKIVVKISAALLLLAVTAPSVPHGETQVRRYLLSAGANYGGRDKVVLRYAVSDARAFANVLMDMGGIEKGNALVLSDPTRRELLGGINDLGKLIASGGGVRAGAGVRSEVFVYYSGHADEDGLKLAGETLGWAEFRNAVSNLNADVRVAVLDACGSGAITRTKGGVARPAFLADASMNMKGYAFLTSSNENEASQESDRIKGSYFTHALLSGMRGAADMTGDGKVTINEAYQYAFNETLQNTQNTRAGTQHPSRDMNLAGTGDIVMTDLRQTNATLSLDADIEGRFFIRDEQGNLFAELRKIRGRPVELGIPPGKYTVQMEAPSRMWSSGSVVVVAGGAKTVITMNDMKPMGMRRRTVARGVDGEAADSLSDEEYGGHIYYEDEEELSGGAAITGDSASAGTASAQTAAAYKIAAASDSLTLAADPTPSVRRGEKTRLSAADIIDDCIIDMTAYADMSDDLALSLRAGMPRVYLLFELSQSAADLGGWPRAWGFGLGTRFDLPAQLVMNVDAVWSLVNTSRDKLWRGGGDREHGDFMFNQFYKTRVGVSYSPRRYLAVTAGLSVTGNYECDHTDTWKKPDRFGSMAAARDGRGHRFHAWPGVFAGLTIGKTHAGQKEHTKTSRIGEGSR